MPLVKNFVASPEFPNRISLSWEVPASLNSGEYEVIITRSDTHFPSELFNEDFPTKATDLRPVEVFRAGQVLNMAGTATVSGVVLTDLSANFTSPLNNRLLRDSNSKVHKIISNTTNTITLETAPAPGKYIVLQDFPLAVYQRVNFISDPRTTAAPGLISNLVVIENNQTIIKQFVPGELSNLVFSDAMGNKYFIKDNTETTITLYEETVIVTLGANCHIIQSFFDSDPSTFTDTFKNQEESDSQAGTGLLDDTFYYYTAFVKPLNSPIAKAQYSNVESIDSTQSYAISAKDTQFGDLLYSYWPEIHKTLDQTEDLYDLMQVFGWQFNQLYSYVKTYNLQDSQKVSATALPALSNQFGLSPIGFTIGADTLRRIAQELINCWKLKGSKEGIVRFIRMITTWDITNGTGDYSASIQDTLPNVAALRFFDSALGSANNRLTTTDPAFIAGGRFIRGLPGIIIPGFFSFREFVLTIPDVALYIGTTTSFTTDTDSTTITDTTASFGADNSLVGNYILSNQEEPSDVYEIISNTSNSVTVKGIVTNREAGGKYAILSPLNTNRFLILISLLPSYSPYGTKSSYDFI